MALLSSPTRGEEPQPASSDLPSAEVIIVLARSLLLTVNDAALTGNFSVLRERADPEFQSVASTGKLGLAFQQLIVQHIDMSEVALATPQFDGDPALNARGQLQIKGTFDIAAGVVSFNFSFKPTEGFWKAMGISVSVAPKAVIQPANKPAVTKPRKKAQPPPAKAN